MVVALAATACGANSPSVRSPAPAPSGTFAPSTAPASSLPSTVAPTFEPTTGAPSTTATGAPPTNPPPGPTSTVPPPPGTPAPHATEEVTTASSGSLTATLTASPSDPAAGGTVEFTVSASDPGAHGVLSHELAYGDGTGDYTATPLLCLATVSPQSQTWHASHAYSAAGTYTVSVTVTANCTPDHVTVSARITVA